MAPEDKIRDVIDPKRYSHFSELSYSESERFLDADELTLHIGIPIPRETDIIRIIKVGLDAMHEEIELMMRQSL